MTNINSLDVETRCWVLVGKFLQNWLAMEQVMRLAMEKVLELDQFQAAIIASNTPLRAKINILRTLVSRLPQPPFDEDKIKQFNNTLGKIEKASWKRNMMAHNAFAPSPDGKGVSFSVTKGKGELTFPDTVCGVAEFAKEYAEIERLKAGLAEIVQAIGEKQVLNKMRDAVRAHPTLLYYTPGFDSSSGAFYSAGGTLVPAAGQENTPLPLLQASLGSESRS
jgi:hypothetical protein